jgi:hypothetical protein
VATTPVDASPAGWRATAEQATRQLAAITAVGRLLGLLVGAVGGRLAMMLLARLNPQGDRHHERRRIPHRAVHRDRHDRPAVDRCPVRRRRRGGLHRRAGPHIKSTLVPGALRCGRAGCCGGGGDRAHRRDRLPPARPSLAGDRPVSSPYRGCMRRCSPDSRNASSTKTAGSRGSVDARRSSTAAVDPAGTLLAVLVLLWASREGLRRTPRGASALAHPAMPWAARLGLAAIFVLSLVDLGKDATELM